MFEVYSKPNCPFCDQAKALLQSRGLEYKEFILDVGQDRRLGVEYVDREEVLALFPGARTMPQIAVYENGVRKVIGGFTQLKEYLGD
jgi:glutaredoxin